MQATVLQLGFLLDTLLDGSLIQSPPNSLNSVSFQFLSGDIDTEIVPEIVKEWEYGFEGRFFNNRGIFDFSYFNRRTDDIVSYQDAAPSTGNNGGIATNTGSAKAYGFEADIGFDIIKNDNFTWNSRVNFYSNKEKLIRRERTFQAFGGQFPLGFGSFLNIPINGARVGKSLGALYGSRILRNDEGIPIINSNGYYTTEFVDPVTRIRFALGDAIPDYRMNFYNTFNYKSWSFSFMIHHKKGGDFFSQVPSILLGRGVTTANLHEHGQMIVIPGVTESGEPNTIAITPEQYWRNNINNGATELKIYDSSIIRLQEMSLSYNLPPKLLNRTPFSALKIIATGYNLWHRAYNLPKGLNIDTNSTGQGPGNNRGIDYSSNAGSRRY